MIWFWLTLALYMAGTSITAIGAFCLIMVTHPSWVEETNKLFHTMEHAYAWPWLIIKALTRKGSHLD